MEFAGGKRLAAVFRLASAGAAPNLKLAGTGAKFDQARPARRVPKLRLADARSRSFARTDPAGSGIAGSTFAGGRAVKLNFAHSRSALRSAGAGVTSLGRTPKLNFGGRKSSLVPPPRRDHGPGKGWIRAGDRPAITPPRSQRGPGKGWIHAGERPAITPPRSQRGPGKGWIRAAGRSGRTGGSGGSGSVAGIGAGRGFAVAGRRSPASGWLRTDAHKPPPAARRARPGRGWLKTSKRPRANWYSSGPSTRWVRRSRSKDRWRTRRRSLSGALISGVRDLLPSGDRR
jgi:hypothetical protein